MTYEKAIAILKAGRYNEIEYLQAKDIAVEVLEKQISEQQKNDIDEATDANKVYANVDRALQEIKFLNTLLTTHSEVPTETKKEYSKAIRKLKSMNETAKAIIGDCLKAKEVFIHEGKDEL